MTYEIPRHLDSLDELRDAARGCRACGLWEHATQTVFGEGPQDARVMLVGEQPGDREDREGAPFVGPAGQLLDRALVEAGVDRGTVYVTNAVKHFKWVQQGRRRLHKTPGVREMRACSGWLEQELALIRPEVLVCLGGTAAKAVIHKDFKITRQRGEFVDSEKAPHVYATVHPSYLLRIPEEAAKAAAYDQFVADLGLIREALAA